MELNPNHPTTQISRELWYKFVAILLMRHGDATITLEEVQSLPQDMAVAVQELDDGLHLRLISADQALALAQKHGGLPH